MYTCSCFEIVGNERYCFCLIKLRGVYGVGESPDYLTFLTFHEYTVCIRRTTCTCSSLFLSLSLSLSLSASPSVARTLIASLLIHHPLLLSCPLSSETVQVAHESLKAGLSSRWLAKSLSYNMVGACRLLVL